MVDSDTEAGVEVTDEVTQPEFDHLSGIIADGFIGAVGGGAGTAAMTVVLLAGATVGGFDFVAFAELASLTGLAGLFPLGDQTIGYLVFLIGGMVPWPLLLASIGEFLPGGRFAARGTVLGAILWTGFVMAFHTGQTGTALALYVVITLVAHLVYGFTLGSVFDYFSNRPTTLV